MAAKDLFPNGRAQLALDGRLGKDFIVTDYMGWRIHPIHHTKRFHNGTDICSKHPVAWIEAPYFGKVIEAVDGNGSFGCHVVIWHKINGRAYTTLFAHMEHGSLKVKKGQRIKAGTPLGKMGSTGDSTGRHLHWELQLGDTHIWSATGKNFIEPIKFFSALIAQESALLKAAVEADKNAPALTKPIDHSFEAGQKLQADIDAAKAAGLKTTDASGALVLPADPHAAPAPAPAPVAAAPAVATTPAPAAYIPNPGYPGHYIQKGSADHAHVKYVQQQLHLTVDGIFGDKTHAAVVGLQRRHGLDADGVIGPRTWATLG